MSSTLKHICPKENLDDLSIIVEARHAVNLLLEHNCFDVFNIIPFVCINLITIKDVVHFGGHQYILDDGTLDVANSKDTIKSASIKNKQEFGMALIHLPKSRNHCDVSTNDPVLYFSEIAHYIIAMNDSKVQKVILTNPSNASNTLNRIYP